MIATEDSNATKTKHNKYTTKLNNWYLLNYLTLLRLLPTNEPTKRLNVPVQGINRNWHYFDNWVRNTSSRPLDRNETRVLSYGLKHSFTPKRIPTEVIVSSVEAALSRERELSESTIALPLYNQRHNILFLSVVLWHTNCPSTWRQYYNRWPTNPDENYNLLRTSLTPLRLYRYLTTTK